MTQKRGITHMQKGIFCLEGLWDDDLKQKSSVQPILHLLEINGGIPFIYHDAATVEELEFYVSKWKQARYRNYPILYLAFHGENESLLVGRQKYHLGQLANVLRSSCADSFFIFASCKTMMDGHGTISEFMKTTEALAVFGYRNRVCWMYSAALELLILTELQKVDFSAKGMKNLEKKISTFAGAFQQIDYTLVIRHGARAHTR
ncbi:MAG: DUF6642 family protein [Fibrobacterota bacterium]